MSIVNRLPDRVLCACAYVSVFLFAGFPPPKKRCVFIEIFSCFSLLYFAENLLPLRTSVSPTPQNQMTLAPKVMDEVNKVTGAVTQVTTNGVAQVAQGVSLVRTADPTEGVPTIKVEPTGESPCADVVTSSAEKEKPAPHPMHAMASVMKNTSKGQ